jgi:hypothetical protein
MKRLRAIIAGFGLQGDLSGELDHPSSIVSAGEPAGRPE